jgi:hypothetical protein
MYKSREKRWSLLFTYVVTIYHVCHSFLKIPIDSPTKQHSPAFISGWEFLFTDWLSYILSFRLVHKLVITMSISQVGKLRPRESKNDFPQSIMSRFLLVEIRSCEFFCLGWFQTWSLLITTSWIVRITCISHHVQLLFCFLRQGLSM